MRNYRSTDTCDQHHAQQDERILEGWQDRDPYRDGEAGRCHGQDRHLVEHRRIRCECKRWCRHGPQGGHCDHHGEVRGQAHKVGTATITAKSGDKSATCAITVEPTPVTSVTLNKTSATLKAGETVTLTATVKPDDATDKTVIWSSTDGSVASVSDGVVTAHKVGTATITAKSGDKSATCAITVEITHVTSVSLNINYLILTVDQSKTLKATISPSTASNKSVNWSSSNNSIVTVDNKGLVTAKSAGEAKITVCTEDGNKSAYCDVWVTLPPSDLSATESANCYIISSSGAYSFRATKGNSSTSIGSVSNVSVLWESYGNTVVPSVGSIINNVSYNSTTNTISFFTPSSLKDGNAVIVAKNSSGTILWSWHIWVCKDYDPAKMAQTYYDNNVMMDRNLGATSATSGNILSHGLLYQWGRKDPFLGKCNYSSPQNVASTYSWPSMEKTTSKVDVDYSIKNPTTFFMGVEGTKYDWVYASRLNELWSDSNGKKTIYDPCPPGWRVPGQIEYKIFPFDCASAMKGDGYNLYAYLGSSNPIWYPCTSYIDGTNGVRRFFFQTQLWTRVCDTKGYYFQFNSTKASYSRNARAYGYSVRCQKIK